MAKPPGTHRRPVLVVLFLVVGLVGATVVAQQDDTDSAESAAGGASSPLVAAGAPEGLVLDDAYDLPGPFPTETLWLYGNPPAANPVGSSDLGLFLSGRDDSFLSGDDVVPQDGAGSFVRNEDRGWGLVTRTMGPGVLTAVSRSLTRRELVAVADSVEVQGGVVAKVDLPPGLDEVATGEVAPVGSTGFLLPSDGSLAAYDRGGGREVASGPAALTVASLGGGSASLLIARWIVGSGGTPTFVRGRDALAQTATGPDADPLSALTWQEPDGLVGMLVGEGDTIAQAVDSLRRLPEDEWRALTEDPQMEPAPLIVTRIRPTPSTTVALRAEVEVASGQVEGGAWRLYARPSQSEAEDGPALCLRVIEASRCTQLARETTYAIELPGEVDAVYGLAGRADTTVRAEYGGGSADAVVAPVPGTGIVAFAAVGLPSPVRRVVLLGPDGELLSMTTFSG